MTDQDAQLTAALDEALHRLATGASIEQCLAAAPLVYRAELEDLLLAARQVHGVRRDPSIVFQRHLESKLLAAVDERRPMRRANPLVHWWNTLRSPALARVVLALVAVLLLSSVVGFGALAASEDALPGSPLYSVKLAREGVELAIARDRVARVLVSVRLARQRARELERAVEQQAPSPLIEGLARSLAMATERVVDETLTLSPGGSDRSAPRVRQALRAEQARLSTLRFQAAPEVRPALARLEETLAHQVERLPPGSVRGS